MGDRSNLAIIDSYREDGEPIALVVHTHWAGSRLPHNVCEYLIQHEGVVDPTALFAFLQDRQVRPELATFYFDPEASNPTVWALDVQTRTIYAARVGLSGDGHLTKADLEGAKSWSASECQELHAVTPEQVQEWRHLPDDCIAGNLYAAPEPNVEALASRADMHRVRQTLRMHEEFENRQAAREAETAFSALTQTQDRELSH